MLNSHKLHNVPCNVIPQFMNRCELYLLSTQPVLIMLSTTTKDVSSEVFCNPARVNNEST